MASIIKSNTYADFNGREILTANNQGALTTQKINYPAFSVFKTTNQTVTDNVLTLVDFDIEEFDTDSAYNLSTNTFTVPTGAAGKYLFNYQVGANSTTGIDYLLTILEKNATKFVSSFNDVGGGSDVLDLHNVLSVTLDLSDGDTIKPYARLNGEPSGSYRFNGNTGTFNPRQTTFSGMRIGS